MTEHGGHGRRTKAGYHSSVNIVSFARRALAQGLRGRNPGLTFVGAALLARSAIRHFSRSDRELLFSRTLKPGEGLRIRSLESGEEIEVQG